MNNDSQIVFGQAPAVDRYKSALEAPTRPLPSARQIKAAISSLLNDPGSVTLDTLEDIMMIRYLPNQFEIVEGPIIPACIAILQQSAKQGKILGNRAGVLALQILCFSISITFLVQNEEQYRWYSQFQRSIASERASGRFPPFVCDASTHVVGFYAGIMEDIIKKKSNKRIGHGLAGLHDCFDWTQIEGPLLGIERLGYFTKDHARFLLNELWSQRDSIMQPFRDVFFPGWTLVIHILWKHIIFWREPQAESMSMRDKLRELVIRSVLVCVSHEDYLLHRHFLDLDAEIEEPPKRGPVNRQDLEMVVSCCVLKLSPPHEWPGAPKQIPLDLANDILNTIFDNIHRIRAHELFLPLLKAGFVRFWFELSNCDPRKDEIAWTEFVPFTYNLIQVTRVNLLLAKQPFFQRRVVSYPIMSVVLESDLVAAVGRFCLMPILFKEIPPGVEKGEKIQLETGGWTDLDSLYDLIDALSGFPSEFLHPEMAPYASEWLNTYYFMIQIDGQMPLQHRLRRWFGVCSSMWIKFGGACGFQLPKTPCANARCPLSGAGPSVKFLCERCRLAAYCSVRCQKMDWSSKLQPHQSVCQKHGSTTD